MLSIFKMRDLELSTNQVNTTCTKPCPALKLAEDVTVGPLEKGAETRMPLWAAEHLAEKGIVEVKDAKSISSAELSKALWKETRTSLPSKLDEPFYPRVRHHLRTLQMRSLRQSSGTLIREEEQARQNLQDLLHSRLQKILQIIITPTPPTAALENLTPEETFLYSGMKGVLEPWLRDALEITGS